MGRACAIALLESLDGTVVRFRKECEQEAEFDIGEFRFGDRVDHSVVAYFANNILVELELLDFVSDRDDVVKLVFTEEEISSEEDFLKSLIDARTGR